MILESAHQYVSRRGAMHSISIQPAPFTLLMCWANIQLLGVPRARVLVGKAWERDYYWKPGDQYKVKQSININTKSEC